MNLDLEDSILTCVPTRAFGNACRLSFKQDIVQTKIYTYLDAYVELEIHERTE